MADDAADKYSASCCTNSKLFPLPSCANLSQKNINNRHKVCKVLLALPCSVGTIVNFYRAMEYFDEVKYKQISPTNFIYFLVVAPSLAFC